MHLRKVLVSCSIVLVLVGCTTSTPPTSTPLSMVTVAPQATPNVGDISVAPTVPVGAGQKIILSVSVSSLAAMEITYKWNVHGNGKIVSGENDSAITYQAPTDPGTYPITVQVSGGGTTVTRNTTVTVSAEVVKTAQDATATTVNITPGEVQPCKEAVCITSPKNKGIVSISTLVEGTLQKPLVSGEEFWVLIVPGGTNRYHPQRGSTVTNLDWSVLATIGQQQDKGTDFTIYAGIADTTAAKAFADYLANADAMVRWDGMGQLPKGFNAPQTSIIVVKRD